MNKSEALASVQFKIPQLPLTNMCVAEHSVDIQMAVPGLSLPELMIQCEQGLLTVDYHNLDTEEEVPSYARLLPGDSPRAVVDGWCLGGFPVKLALPEDMVLVRAMVDRGILAIRLERLP